MTFQYMLLTNAKCRKKRTLKKRKTLRYLQHGVENIGIMSPRSFVISTTSPMVSNNLWKHVTSLYQGLFAARGRVGSGDMLDPGYEVGTELASDHGIPLRATPPDITWVLSCCQSLYSTCTFHNWNITIIK